MPSLYVDIVCDGLVDLATFCLVMPMKSFEALASGHGFVGDGGTLVLAGSNCIQLYRQPLRGATSPQNLIPEAARRERSGWILLLGHVCFAG